MKKPRKKKQLNLIPQLLKSFNHIQFVERNHTYNNLELDRTLKSVTTVLNSLKQKFNRDYWSRFKAEEAGVTQEEILQEWDYKRHLGISRGNFVHDKFEKLLQRKTIRSPKNSLDKFGPYSKDYLEHTAILNQQMVEAIRNYPYIPIVQEYVVGNDIIGGMLDNISYNEKTKNFIILDYKTDKQFNYKSPYKKKFLKPLSHLDECEYNKYALQLSLYRLIIEQAIPDIRFDDNTVIWFYFGANKAQIIKLPYYKKEAEDVFEFRRELVS